MFYQLAAAAGFMLAGVLGCAAYFWGTSFVLDLIFPSKGKSGAVASRNLRITNAIRPWLFLTPALFALATYLIYPVIMSLWYSFHDRAGQSFVGVSNYAWMVNDGEFLHIGTPEALGEAEKTMGDIFRVDPRRDP